MLSREPVTLLGATSFVGRGVLNRLLDDGRTVIAVSRKPPMGQTDQRVQWMQLDIGDSTSRSEEFSSPLIISAAPIHVTAIALEKYATSSIRRIVAVSSTSVLTKPRARDASDRNLAAKLIGGEHKVMGGHWASTVLRPTMIYHGAGDGNVDTIFRQLTRSRFFPLVGGGSGLRQPIHAFDVVEAVCSVVDNSATVGKTYEIGGAETLTFRSMVSRIADVNNLSVSFVNIPLPIGRALHRIVGQTSHLSRVPIGALNRMSLDMYFDISEAVRDFSFQPRPFDPPRLRTSP